MANQFEQFKPASAVPPLATPPGPAPTPGQAIAALVMGILSIASACFCVGVVFGILGLVFGLNSTKRIDASKGALSGRGMARAGTILSIVGLSLSIIAFLIGMLLPALGAARRTARQMQSNTQVRSIHQSLIVYAQGNNAYYPGLDNLGNNNGITVENRYFLLLDNNYFTGEYAISPADGQNKIEWFGGPVTPDNYSYAMLEIAPLGDRRDEWKETFNAQAAVMSDRNTGMNATTQASSIHTDTNSGDWRGSVAWNDNSVMFETTQVLETKYARGNVNPADNLFEEIGSGDAYMIDQGK